MFIIKCIIDKYCKTKDGKVYACFVDFQKAFDTVMHTGIKIKLLSIEVGSKFYEIIKDMYEVSKSCVKLQNHITDNFPINLGVNQGDNLTPSFFKISINDLPDYIEDSIDPILLNNKPLNCLLYADDLVLFSTSAKGLQTRLDKLQKYCKDWCLKVNPNKTKVLVFNKDENKILDCVVNYKYLGLHFSHQAHSPLLKLNCTKKHCRLITNCIKIY